MAADPTIKVQHIWHALMHTLGPGHLGLRRRNRAIQHDILNLMRPK